MNKIERLNPVNCDRFATILGGFDAEAEKNYRRSLAFVDSSPRLATFLQALAFIRVGTKAAILKRDLKRICSRNTAK